MSIEAMGWALWVPVGGNMKIMLLGLANHAHHDGTEAYPSLDTLAAYGDCDRSTARRNTRRLVDEGWIEEDGKGPIGQVKYRLCLERGGKTPPVAPEPQGGGIRSDEGVAPMPPEPSKEPFTKPRTENARDTRQRIPPDFPDELRPHARTVMKVLRDVAIEHNAKEVTARGVARLMMAPQFRHKPWTQEVHKFASWADDRTDIRDVTARFRRWIENSTSLAGVERIEPEGAPPPNVHRFPAGGRSSKNRPDHAAALRAMRLAKQEAGS